MVQRALDCSFHGGVSNLRPSALRTFSSWESGENSMEYDRRMSSGPCWKNSSWAGVNSSRMSVVVDAQLLRLA